MKVGRTVDNGSNGKGHSSVGLPAEVTERDGPARASNASDKGKGDGSLQASQHYGRTPGALSFSPGGSAPPNSELKIADPEVKVRRRRHTREYKLSILKQAGKLKGKPGEIGEFLRREGLYSSALVQWKKQRDEGILGVTRGRKPRPAEVLEIEKLKKQVLRLEEKNRQYVLVIETQKKMSEILGIRQDNVPPMPEDED